jgi:hypothetical protein
MRFYKELLATRDVGRREDITGARSYMKQSGYFTYGYSFGGVEDCHAPTYGT